APRLIASVLPDVKLIYIMREPVQRAYSHFIHRYEKERFPGQPFRMSFEEFIELDPMVIQSSDYLTQIDKYLEVFPRESLLLLVFEDFTKNPVASLGKVFNFLGIDDHSESIGREQLRENTRESFARNMMRARAVERLQRIPGIKAMRACLPKPVRDQFYTKV